MNTHPHSTESLPTTARAALLRAVGEALTLTRIDLPPMTPDRVLVRVLAAGLNPLDAKIRIGKAAHAAHPLPAVLAKDMVGEVIAVGAAVTGFAPGDRVFGMTGGVGGHQGALAEYQVADPALLAQLPASVSVREAAATPLVFITAWEALVDRARVGPGMKVLVHGGAGGVGHVAIQIARARGAEVYATGSAHDAALIAGLGARFIDYRAEAVEAYVAAHTGGEGFDVILDTVGGATLDASFAAVRRYTGQVVSILGWGSHSLAPLSFRGASYSGVFTLYPLISGQGRAHHGAIMAEAARLFAEGRLCIRVDPRRFDLSQAEAAYGHLESGQASGKVVVEVAGT